jgi:integrase
VRLLSAAGRIDPRVELALLLGADAGLRKGEIVALEQPDLDHARRLVHVRRGDWRGVVSPVKGWQSRVVPMTDRLAEAALKVRHLAHQRVLLRDDGRPITAKVVQLWVRSAERVAGMEETGRVHVLRHTFGARLAMKGAPAMAIMKLMGHKDLKTTLRYMHLSPSAREGAIRLLDETGNQRATERRTKEKPR